MLKQSQHQPGGASNERCEGRKTVFPRLVGMGHTTWVWFGINAVACHVDLLVRFLSNHFGIYPVARGIREHLEGLIQTFPFYFREVRALRQAPSLFNHHSKEIPCPGVNLYSTTQPRRLESVKCASRLDTKCIDNSWNTTIE